MSMKEAIEVLRAREQTIFKQYEDGLVNASYLDGFSHAITCLVTEQIINHTWQPSEDTQYKKSLTAWIYKKKWFESYDRIKNKDLLYKDENPYSLFEAWQANSANLDHLEAEAQRVQNSSKNLKSSIAQYRARELTKDLKNKGVGKPLEVCPRTCEEGEG